MKIIIVGCGRVGRALVAQLSREDNDITIIDTDADVVNRVSQDNDVMGVIGNGASHITQQKAGISEADLLIAVTDSDEMNMLCCIVAKKEGKAKTIARIRNHEYISEIPYLKDELGLAMIINPELATAKEIFRVLNFPSAISVDQFSGGRVELIKFKLPDDCCIAGMSIKEVMIKYSPAVLFATAERDNDAFILKGDFVFQPKDVISMVCTPSNAASFFKKLGFNSDIIKNSIIIGGGEITHYLVSMMSSYSSVKVFEPDEEICRELSAEYPFLTVVNTNLSDHDALDEEGIEGIDSFIALGDSDEENIIISLYAKSKNSRKVITKIKRMDYDNVVGHLDMDTLVSPMKITTDTIVRYVRGAKNTLGSNMENFYILIKDKVEASEFIIKENSAVTDRPLISLSLKPNILVGAIIRDDKVIIPRGSDEIKLGDSVIIVSKNIRLNDVTDILST